MAIPRLFAKVAFFCVVFCVSIPVHGQAPLPPAQKPQKFALLIGIGTYDHPGVNLQATCTTSEGRCQPGLIFHDLKGPPNDVAAIQKLLVSKFEFPVDGTHMKILAEEDATRAGILAAMQKYLVDDPNPGDTAVLYISSHGSLRANPSPKNPDRKENTIVPYDWYLPSANDIFSWQIRHIFNEAEDKGVHVTAMFDSCFSGLIARGIVNPKLVARDIPFDPRLMPPDAYPNELVEVPPEHRGGPNAVLVLSAAQENQEAIDDETGQPADGLFTRALIDTFNVLSPDSPVSQVFDSLKIAMDNTVKAQHSDSEQQPDLDTTDERKARPLFFGDAIKGPMTTAVVSVTTSHTSAVLDIGVVQDIGPGSEFALNTGKDGGSTLLRVGDPIGIGRSNATVVSGTVKPGDIIQLSKWVPAQRTNVSFFVPTVPSQAEILATLGVLRNAKLQLATDPTSDPWTHRLEWDGTKWLLYVHSKKNANGQIQPGSVISLGAKITPSSLKKIPPQAILWFDAPFPRELMAGLLPVQTSRDAMSLANLTSDRSHAIYVLAGTATASSIQYAWVNRGDMDAERQTPLGLGAGCSATSSFPLRTNWVPFNGTQSTGAALTESATQLIRLNWWLNRSSLPPGQIPFAYTLEIQDNNGKPIENGITPKGDYNLVLNGNPNSSVSQRWVYVISIDCQGSSAILYPYQEPPGEFPNGLTTSWQKPFSLAPPFGNETYLLLTTSDPLSNLSALEFSGVASTSQKTEDPLNGSYDPTSSQRPASRGIQAWSVQSIHMQSMPATTAPAASAH